MKTFEQVLQEERQRWITYNRLEKVNESGVETSIIKSQKKMAELNIFRIREVLKQRKQNEL